MLLNSLEYWTMNNPLRGAIQRYYEAPRLRRLAKGNFDDVLEIGCGQGQGARIIHELFNPRRYVGIDLDSRMIRRAKRKANALRNAEFMTGDASRLAFQDASFDLVVDFGVVHHIPNWKDAVAEVYRTLRPGGEFLFEDLSLETWESGIGKPLKNLLEHPYDRMFRTQEFLDELRNVGFSVETYENSPFSFYHFWGRAEK